MVRFHPGLLTMPRYANRQSGSAQTRGFAGSIPALGTRRIRPRGAAECSPACHAGDRGFKSHRGRSTWHGAPIRQSDQTQTLVDGGSSPSRATETTCVGWALASPSGCNPLAIAVAVRLRPDALTTWPVLLTVQDTRPSFCCYGFDSRTGYSVTSLQVRQVSNWLSYGRCARLDTGTCNLTRVGQCSSRPHKPGLPGATPGPAI